jgi:hypothetical protein
MSFVKQILTTKSNSEIEALARQYFSQHGYYEKQVASGLRFLTYEKGKNYLDPARIPFEVQIDTHSKGGQQQVVTKLEKDGRFSDRSNHGKTPLDEIYYKDFLNHWEKALTTGTITLFDTSKYQKSTAQYSKYYMYSGIIALFLIVAFFLFFQKDIGTFNLLIVFFILQGFGFLIVKSLMNKGA